MNKSKLYEYEFIRKYRSIIIVSTVYVTFKWIRKVLATQGFNLVPVYAITDITMYVYNIFLCESVLWKDSQNKSKFLNKQIISEDISALFDNY